MPWSGRERTTSPKNYGLLPDGRIPADPPKDAPRLREGRKEGRKEGQDGWSQKAPLFITICILGRPRGPDAGGFMEIGTVESNRKSIPLSGQGWLPRSIFAGSKERKRFPQGQGSNTEAQQESESRICAQHSNYKSLPSVRHCGALGSCSKLYASVSPWEYQTEKQRALQAFFQGSKGRIDYRNLISLLRSPSK